MATFCYLFKMPPSEYRKLTVAEFQAFLKVKGDAGTTNDLEDLLNG
jgi:hypothetical protein